MTGHGSRSRVRRTTSRSTSGRSLPSLSVWAISGPDLHKQLPARMSRCDRKQRPCQGGDARRNHLDVGDTWLARPFLVPFALGAEGPGPHLGKFCGVFPGDPFAIDDDQMVQVAAKSLNCGYGKSRARSRRHVRRPPASVPLEFVRPPASATDPKPCPSSARSLSAAAAPLRVGKVLRPPDATSKAEDVDAARSGSEGL